MNNINWIENWYSEYCDGDWEHSKGVSITTLDNPGWAVDISLEGTDFEDKEFNALIIDRTEGNWVNCKVIENVYQGRGGANNLEELLTIFKMWCEDHLEEEK